jgi:hypothetical protein
MSILLDYDVVGMVFTKNINGDYDTWQIVDYLGENAYLVKGKDHGYKLIVREQIPEY